MRRNTAQFSYLSVRIRRLRVLTDALPLYGKKSSYPELYALTAPLPESLLTTAGSNAGCNCSRVL